MEDWSPWLGRSEERGEIIDAARAQALAATLDGGGPALAAGAALPPLWHWLYFWPQAGRSALGGDGHPRLGGFLPPLPLPRRMWAGGQLEFLQPLQLGEQATRRTTITGIQTKAGRSGALVFLQLRHEISGAAGLAIREVQDIVYREAAAPGAAGPEPGAAGPDPQWLREVVPDEALLFRYSALTFNAHRIHYDQPYATRAEGYAGLVVHGPLIATLLLEHLRERLPRQRVRGFGFRAVGPLVHTDRFALCAEPAADGASARLWARRHDGALCMQASASLGPADAVA